MIKVILKAILYYVTQIFLIILIAFLLDLYVIPLLASMLLINGILSDIDLKLTKDERYD